MKYGTRFGLIVGVSALAFSMLGAYAQQRAPRLAEPSSALSGEELITQARSIINSSSVIGQPFVYMINATGQDLLAVTCDGKWQLVGKKPYIPGAPDHLPAGKVTLVGTKGFDGYCKQSGSIVGQSETDIYVANLISSDGTFSSATYLTFWKPKQ